jgi:chemotaxis protein CheD
VDQLFLLPGDTAVTRTPTLLATLLGSCVSVCLSNGLQHMAGMNHYLLPEAAGSADLGRYGDTSIQKIVQALFVFDADPTHYRARIYGGSSVIGPVGTFGDIGTRNVEVARRALASFGIAITHENVGGSRGRRIHFNTETNVIECQAVGTTGNLVAASHATKAK